MMDYGFHLEAAREFEAAFNYYESEKAGLGQQFLTEVARTILHIRQVPESGTAYLETAAPLPSSSVPIRFNLSNQRGRNRDSRRDAPS